MGMSVAQVTKDTPGTYLMYELSPRPNDVNLTLARHDGGSFFLSRLFQNSKEFCGMSPWPVVDMTSIKSVWRKSSFYREPVGLVSQAQSQEKGGRGHTSDSEFISSTLVLK